MWLRLERWALRATLIFAFGLTLAAAWESLRIPHDSDEQRTNVGLAMKLGTFGPKLSAYNLGGIGIRGENEKTVFFAQFSGQGDLLRQLAAEGRGFLDQPLYHGPPLYPALLSLSHGLLASAREHAVLTRDERAPDFGTLWKAQGWSVLPTVLFSLLWLLVVYRFGRLFGGAWMGAGCVLLLASSPAFLLVTQRLWADALLGLCMSLSVWIYLRGSGDNRLVVTGLFVGLSLLTKNSGVLLALPLAMHAFGSGERDGILNLFKVVALALVLTALWYFQTVRHLGVPFFLPDAPGISAQNPWYEYLNGRPWYNYVFGVPYQNPLFVFAFLGIPLFLRRREKKFWPLLAWSIGSLLLLTIVTSRSETLGPDHRYLLPAYPAFAVLALTTVHRVALRYRPGPARLVTGVVVAWSAAWSLNVWWSQRGGDLLSVPF